MGRDPGKARNSGMDMNRGNQAYRGGYENRGLGAQGVWRPKEPATDKNYHQEGKPSDLKCFRCLGTGHHQSDCNNDPVCYKCKQKGHMAVDCRTKGKIQMFGFGIPNKGFYSIQILETRVHQVQAAGVVVVLEGDADEDKINEELKMVVDDKWDFKPRRMFSNEFLVVFPHKGTLETFSRCADFGLPIHNLKVKILKSNVDPASSSVLQSCWVRISNIPPIAREENVVKEIASLVGQPVVVDELSLLREDPVRVKVNCRDPSTIRCVIEIFFNKVGHEVKFVVEERSGKSINPKGGPPGNGTKDDKPDRRNQWDEEGSKGKKRFGKFDRIGSIDREKDSSHGGSQDAMDMNHQVQMPIAAFHPSVGLMEFFDENSISKEKVAMVELNGEANTSKDQSKLIWDPTTTILQ